MSRLIDTAEALEKAARTLRAAEALAATYDEDEPDTAETIRITHGVPPFADARDVARSAVRDSIVDGLRNNLVRPHSMAQVAKIGPATVYRWMDDERLR